MLALRDWSVRVLAGRAGDITPELWRAAADSPHHVWGHFLGLERCAHPLTQQLDAYLKRQDATGTATAAAHATRNALRATRHASLELQRALSAARQLRTIGEGAEREGWPCVVLKGGVPAASGKDFLDLHDVDVLVRSEHLPLATAALAEAGYATAPVASRPYHLSPRTAEQSLPVELHTSLQRDGAPPPDEMWERMVTIASTRGLFRLAAQDHLWHVLTHAVCDHPHRASRLRDALLAAQALALCSPPDEAAVARRIDSHLERTRLRATLSLAELVAGKRSAATDPLRDVAASDYLASIAGQHPLCPRDMQQTLTLCAAAIHAGQPYRRKLWTASMSREAAAPHPLVSWLERPLPRAGAGLRVGLRLARLAVAMPAAGLLVMIARGEERGTRAQD
ncbi:MAG TPA: nucleotidyltransferase family protein [Gemmatimonadaceae bacterium]|nr:nucleotidyltransferase family protein [Gemmatimonadaceae bacterium]